MKSNIVASILSLSFSIFAAVPLRWQVETSRLQPAAFDCYHGETLELEAAFNSYGKPLAIEGEAALYYQTNGMGATWWSAPATVSSNRIAAAFTPAMDPGAAILKCFLGGTASTYRAAFTLRFATSPGATPNALPLPTATLDFSAVEVINAPWLTAETDPHAAGIVSQIVDKAYVGSLGITTGIAEETDPTVPAWAKAPAPPVNTNDVENIVTKEEVVGFTPWTARNLPSGVSLIGQPSFYSPSNEWYWDSSGGIAGMFVCYASSEDATELRFKELDDLTDGFTATREPITRNALGLASMGDLPPLTNGIQEAISSQQSQVAKIQQDTDAMWSFVTAENFRVAVTNYDSTAHAPEASFEYRMNTNESFRVVWAETNGLTRTHTAATNDAIQAAKEEMAKPENRAWGRYDATTGAPAPEGIVQVSAEGGLMIGGGMGYTSVAASGGEYWVLSSTDPTLCRTGTNGVFQIIDADGNAAVTVRKSDKRLVPAPAGSIAVSDGSIVISYLIESAEHPEIECSATLDAGGTWHEAGADGAPFGAAVWTGLSGAWVATIQAGGAATGFFRASYWAGGGTVVSYGAAAMEMQRVKIGNVEYAVGTATIDGHTVLTLEAVP